LRRFKGERSIIISTLTVFGGSHHFLAIIYLTVASVFIVFAAIFFFCIKHNGGELKQESDIYIEHHDISPIKDNILD